MNTLPFLIARRFITSQHQQSFTKLTQILAILGIALGVAILIIINAIFSGVEEKITDNIRSINTHIIATPFESHWHDWQNMVRQLEGRHDIVAATPRAKYYGLVQNGHDIEPVIIYALPESYWPEWLSHAEEEEEDRSIPAWVQKDLAEKLYLQPGDTFGAITPETIDNTVTPRGLRFSTQAVFTDPGLDIVRNTLYVKSKALASQLDHNTNSVNEIAITTTNIFASTHIAKKLAQQFPGVTFQDWGETAKAFFDSLRIQKKMMIIVLSLVTCIASFNLITGLVILVMEKKMEIAVLQTMGATQGLICQIFIIQGFVTASIGAALGIMIGLPTALYLTEIVEWLETTLHMKLFSEQVFMLDYLPSKVVASDMVIIVLFVEILALLAALYPAREALRIQPAETIRHE